MSAIFDFTSLITVVLLLICTAAFVREIRPGIYDGGRVRACILICTLVCCATIAYVIFIRDRVTLTLLRLLLLPSFLCIIRHQTYERGFKGRSGFSGFMWKLSRIGERLSPYVAACCIVMAVHLLFFR